MNKLVVFFGFFLFVSCSCNSLRGKKYEVTKKLENIRVQLEEINTKDDLKIMEKKIKKQINDLALLIISMKKESVSQEEIFDILLKAQKESGFEKEFLRVINIDECVDIYQNISLDALYLLDAFERKLQIPCEKNAKLRKIEEY